LRNIEVLKTKEGNVTLCIDKVYLHSKYYPLKEAERFIEENEKIYKDKKYIVIYGIGLGYHLIKLLQKVQNDCKLYIFDTDIEIIKICYDIGILKELEKDKRVELFLGYSKESLNKLHEKMTLVEDIIIYKPSLRVLPECYKDIKGLFKSYELAKIGIQRFRQMALENYEFNVKIKHSIKDFFNTHNFKDKPIIIAAGGPSLEISLKILKDFRSKFYIFAIGQTLKILIDNMIKPDIIVIIDPQDVVYEKQLRGYENLNIPLCFLSTASKLAVENYKGHKYIFFNGRDKNNKDDIIINTGKTVAVAALDIAVKSGAEKIIFTGQDLAFINNRFHAGDKFEDSSYNISTTKVMGINGEMLKTTSGMLEFKRNIERIIQDNPKVIFINSSKGARIKGTLEADLEQFYIKE
jgi:hypothetical protein